MATTAPTTPLAFRVEADNVRYTENEVLASYKYTTTRVTQSEAGLRVTPVSTNYSFKTTLKVPRTGVMIVGWGGNNGTTVTAGVLANKHNITFQTKHGVQKPDYIGSLTQSSTVRIGAASDGSDVHIPFKALLPMVHPNDLVIGGWDINKMDLASAMQRAEVLDWDLQRQLIPLMKEMTPLPSIYIPDFIASNQEDRADNVIKGTKWEMVEQLRNDIRHFREQNKLERVIILWSANTERFCDIVPGKNDTFDNLIAAVKSDFAEVSPSTLFAIASILEGCPYINGSPQNTFVPGVIEMAERYNVLIGGDDFKTGQTKFKSVLVDFLISAGIKPVSIVSYNHLGNNDGKNLSSPQQFRSKEISKSNVVDDMVDSNEILYPDGQKPDHCVVIKYVPAVGDSKRAMDEYMSKIFMGGLSTIAVHNTCEDSLLAAPLILDLIILAELTTRIEYKTDEMKSYEHFHPVASILSYLLKAPQVPPGTPVINALFKQRACLENIFRACVGLAPEHNMGLEYKTHSSFRQ
eukprot:TRINITY_DN1559_c2_g1_i1.p2 TRINITY_DN1559_c2_g1~~TRINITY_DN1559_c2_g1_i1.p2  ORF type:complete len:521 (+),score=137.56 TRINITY_DN1559_c2_g1_i1:67-1629(+)